MNIFRLFTKCFTFISRKLKLYQQEEKERKLREQYGDLTKHHVNNARFEAGEFTYGIPKLTEYGPLWQVKIGNFCCISNNVEFILGGAHCFNFVTSYGFIPQIEKLFPDVPKGKPVSNKIIIGNDVWIGKNATLLSDVKIGDGAVIGANAMVAKDVPPYAIVVGNPARIIKYRFDEETVQALLRIKWWDWPLEKLQKNMRMIQSDNLGEFIKLHDVKD